MAVVGLSGPWYSFYREVNELFKNDKQVHVVLDDEHFELNIYVENANKAAALEYLLGSERVYGELTLYIKVIPANNLTKSHRVRNNMDLPSLYRDAFNGNTIVELIEDVSTLYSNDMCFIVFRKEVVQYFTDDLGDYYGQRSTLWQDIANDVFEQKNGIFFCTSKNSFTGEHITSTYTIPYNILNNVQ